MTEIAKNRSIVKQFVYAVDTKNLNADTLALLASEIEELAEVKRLEEEREAMQNWEIDPMREVEADIFRAMETVYPSSYDN